jgi:hypothetical protein
MTDPLYSSMANELEKISVARIKSNDRYVSPTKAHVAGLMQSIESWESPHREKALSFASELSPPKLFEVLHGMRRWYTGQTMAKKLVEHNEALSKVMKLEPKDVVGIFRGFKVPKDSPIAQAKPGDTLELDVTRNRGLSSWSTNEQAVNRFSGAGNGKVGLNVKLVGSDGVKPLLAPPSHTEPWFNELYSRAIGKSFRPTEGEYLISAPKIRVEVLRVKR